MEERRRVPRAVALLELKEINNQPGAGSFMLDHSPLGAKLETRLTFAPGDFVEFSYIRPGQEKEIHHWGKVIWVLPSSEKPGFNRLGVEFFRNLS
jgi:hypothetical protein